MSELFNDIFTESGTISRFWWRMLQGFFIFASCTSMLLEFYEPYESGFPGFISALELISVGFFTLDYLGTLYFAAERLRFILSFWGLVDLISIMPTFLLMLNPSSALVVKMLRMLRFLRIVRFWRQGPAAF